VRENNRNNSRPKEFKENKENRVNKEPFVTKHGEIAIDKLKEMKISEINKIAKKLKVNGISSLKKQDPFR
jgi:hypothetical protein